MPGAAPNFLRAGNLTPVWVPDEWHDAMRLIIRARTAAAQAQRVNCQQVSAFLLNRGGIYPRKMS